MDGENHDDVCQADQLAVDKCAGTFRTAKACMMSSKDQLFIAHKTVPMCSNASVPAVVEIVCKADSEYDSYIPGSPEVQEVARRCVTEVYGINARKIKIICDEPAGLSPTQTVLSHILHFLSNKFQNKILYELD